MFQLTQFGPELLKAVGPSGPNRFVVSSSMKICVNHQAIDRMIEGELIGRGSVAPDDLPEGKNGT